MTAEDQECLAAGRRLFLEKAESELICFDVGCNINMTLGDVLTDFTGLILASGLPVKQIYVFEPVHWQRFADRYKDDGRVTVVCKALSEVVGKRTMFCPQPHGLSSLIHRDVFKTLPDKASEIEIDCDTVDNFMKTQEIKHLDYLKIDVEGAELMVLKGAKNALKNGMISGGQFEYGDTLTDARTSLEEVVLYLKEFGYHVCHRTTNNCVFKKD